MSGPGAGFSLSDGWDLSGLTLAELWLRYLAVGGTASPGRLSVYARGQLHPVTSRRRVRRRARSGSRPGTAGRRGGSAAGGRNGNAGIRRLILGQGLTVTVPVECRVVCEHRCRLALR
jgi:hypothetical protein